ncbi:hypothetical protein [Roseateles paludis]|uniref:Uncharacterized protein n=1 Tax=Roseateles paludis TaxID=3145238 RepID=A0ABV0G087_9BURK
MPKTAERLIFQGACFTLLCSLTSSPWALGVEPPLVRSRLGQPLDLLFPINLGPSEALSEQCLRVDVQAGDARVPAGLLQMRLEGEPPQLRARLTSAVRVDEPVVQVSLAVGCPSRFTREFMALLEQAPAAAPPPASRPAVPAVLPEVKPAERPPIAAPAPAPAAAPIAAAAPTPPREAATPPAPPPTKASAPSPRAERPVAVRKPPASAQPRLRLDAPEILQPPAPRVSPAAPPPPDDSNDAALEEVVARLEAQVAQLQAELRERQAAAAGSAPAATASAPEATASAPVAQASAPADDAIVAVRTQRPPKPLRYADPLMWFWTLALSLGAGVAAYRWTLSRERRQRGVPVWGSLGAAAPAEAEVSRLAPDGAGAQPVLGGADALPSQHSQHSAHSTQPASISAFAPAVESRLPAELPDEGQVLLSQRTAPLLPAAAMAETQPLNRRLLTPPPVSEDPRIAQVDSLLELQRQVEFLSMLGQLDAVADALAARVNQPQCGPMPYLMLMELCQVQGESRGFAELSLRYEAAFRRPSPSWQVSIGRGKPLDACLSVMAHLQVVWADPPAALRMLTELVVRGSGPGESGFDLPAFKDLLTLFSVARDRVLSGEAGPGVDLVL